ncbi:Fic family protein [Candidatus Peregrinibacteria bacterium]|nr:Fic family protein [Candidatus Peregrinibacteria bacterium]
MKYLTKKVIKGKSYYYLQYENYTKNIGHFLPDDLKSIFFTFFQEIATKKFKNFPKNIKKDFRYLNVQHVEKTKFWYLLLKHELFEREHHDFYKKFIVLFTYHSNKTEGSKTKKKDIEEMDPWTTRKPVTKTEVEILHSFMAFHHAFSDDMKWNVKNIRQVHRLLLEKLDPIIAGQWKKENNIAPSNDTTTDFREVPHAMNRLIHWLRTEMKNDTYPPMLALQFYCTFEKIHPFLDGNGRVGRILCNSILDKFGYPPVIFFTDNKTEHSSALRAFSEGRPMKMYKHFLNQLKKTYKALGYNLEKFS